MSYHGRAGDKFFPELLVVLASFSIPNACFCVYILNHKICWKEAKILQIEPKTTYRKYKESAHMRLLDHPISQPSLDISPIWTPGITAEVKKTATLCNVD
jgi:hypothetical protein